MVIVLSAQPIKSTYILKKILFKQAFLIKKLFESQIINKKNFKKIKYLRVRAEVARSGAHLERSGALARGLHTRVLNTHGPNTHGPY